MLSQVSLPFSPLALVGNQIQFKNCSEAWRDACCLVMENDNCSCGGREFSFQHPHQASPSPLQCHLKGTGCPLPGSEATCMCMCMCECTCTHTHAHTQSKALKIKWDSSLCWVTNPLCFVGDDYIVLSSGGPINQDSPAYPANT